MDIDLSVINIYATRQAGKPASMLAEMGIRILSIEGEGNIDRYIISERLAIERRDGNSFLQGIMDKTLYTSAIYLRENFNTPILIVEGDIRYECRGFNPQAVRGALSSMILLYGIDVLSTPNVEETAMLIAMMARHEQIGTHDISLIPKRKAMDIPDMQRRIIEMLPGCGVVMARDLLNRFGSVKGIINASEEDFLDVPGIGKKKAEEIYQILNVEYESVDTEKNLEDAVEKSPDLIFAQPVELLARQHYIYTDEKERHIVDLVFLDANLNELILVELKRNKLLEEHLSQIRRYLDNSYKSSLLREFLDNGAKLRGILATIEHSSIEPKYDDVSICIIDKDKVIDVLKKLRIKPFCKLNRTMSCLGA